LELDDIKASPAVMLWERLNDGIRWAIVETPFLGVNQMTPRYVVGDTT
jgi:hypothetical protein